MAFHALGLDTLAHKGTITAVDVVRLHDALTFDGPVTEQEARELFAIELSSCEKHASWKGVFIDALTEFAIHHTAPHGYLTALKADWMLRLAAPEGRVLSANTFALLQTLLSLARWAPERLISTLLDEVYCAVAAGDGPLRHGQAVAIGTITGRDCDVIRHILYSAGTCGQGSITRVEAEGLFAINSVITAGDPLSGWSELFGKAIGDCLLSVSGHTGPVREVFLCPDHGSTSAVAGLVTGFGRYHRQSNEDRAIAALERQRVSIITGDDIRPITAGWLAGALERHHQRPSVAVAALMEALSMQHSELDGVLSPVVGSRPAVRAA
ncbi:MAG: hypothetical protein ABL901_07205 [Hyphomicrobiaceae bacterium]